jgi:hypothetical protein
MSIRSKKPTGSVSTSTGIFEIGTDMFLSPEPTPEQEADLLNMPHWFEKAERPRAAPKAAPKAAVSHKPNKPGK